MIASGRPSTGAPRAPNGRPEARDAVVVALPALALLGFFLALYPLAHESLCLRYDYPHVTQQAIYTFNFVVDASHQAMGVVRDAYVECVREPIR